MIFNEEASIFSFVYGPATKSLLKTLNENTKRAKENNGLIKSILEISDFLIVDSINYPSEYNKIFFKDNVVTNSTTKNFKSSFKTNKINEHDIDNSIFLFFRFFSKKTFFESMINPPGGDWSNIDLIDNKKNVYRWTNLPRVSGENTKRPDHIYIFDTDNKNKIGLIIESKYRKEDLEKDIGERLIKYIENLTRFKPNCIKLVNDKKFIHNNTKKFNQKIIFNSAVAYYSNNQSSKKEMISKMIFFKTSNLFEINYDSNFKIIIKFFTKNLDIYKEFKKNIIDTKQIKFSVIKI